MLEAQWSEDGQAQREALERQQEDIAGEMQQLIADDMEANGYEIEQLRLKLMELEADMRELQTAEKIPAREKAEQIYERLKNGEDPEDVIDGEGISAETAAIVDAGEQSRYPAEIIDAALSLSEDGMWSTPVEIETGYCLIQRISKPDAGAVPFETAE